jgi:hypothetical protein
MDEKKKNEERREKKKRRGEEKKKMSPNFEIAFTVSQGRILVTSSILRICRHSLRRCS